jgi:hypothetical protein
LCREVAELVGSSRSLGAAIMTGAYNFGTMLQLCESSRFPIAGAP